MSRQQISNHYTRLLRLWPVDRLRPAERQFQRLLEHRIQHSPASGIDESKEVNAAYLLLDNTASRQFPLSERLMKPQSDPQHYEALAREIEEVPDRTFWGRLKKRLGGMVRMK
ncbi:hypothetical protein LTR09_009023 [Extremus antarcticus]|uniref:Uncharacterized protein n=1 Tax=Extremus antarcticus TaxID=702011 RepID=A0AAJ0D9H3_9PEZI|nr:hypothetical protein LTR09_009023 [Extremus antarcticus]